MRRTLVLASAVIALVVAVGLFLRSSSLAEPATAEVEIKLPRPGYVGTPKDLPKHIERPAEGKVRKSWVAPRGTALLSLKKPVTSSEKDPLVGQLDCITDGDKEAGAGSYVELGTGLQWVQIDLGASHALTGVLIWHKHDQPSVYKDVVVQVSDDVDFINGVTTVFNNDADNSAGLGIGRDREYLESHEGKLVVVPSAGARYVRVYGKGSLDDETTHFTEVEVFGVK
jgi:hypothetical protein